MRFAVFFIALFFSFPSAYAQEVDPRHFKDWLTLADLLRSQGIDIPRTSWTVIEPRCLPLKTNDSQVEYNRCKYINAANEHQFRLNRATCDRRANREYPNSLSRLQQTRTIYVQEAIGVSKTITEALPPISRAQLRRYRRAVYEECMEEDFNWQHPENWLDGKRPRPIP